MKLGFVGCGTIAAAMIAGLQDSGWQEAITVSPRNAEVAAGLAQRYANVSVASDNQAVLDAADLVVLAVRPQIAAAVLAELRFRPDHRVLSVIATLSLETLRSVVAPAVTVTRAVPLPSVARRQGPTAVFPPDEEIVGLFDTLGTAIGLGAEAEFDAFSAATATMASYFAFADTIADWMTRHGVGEGNARRFVADMFRGLDGAADAEADKSFATLADEHQTRGGLNEQVYRAITRDGTFVELDRALDAILDRVRG
jgi:pyrroline-5-carboxylate reductase